MKRTPTPGSRARRVSTISVAEAAAPNEHSMRHILVLQWPTSSAADLEELVRMEEELQSLLGDHAIVGGHDFGSGEMNIFIETDHPVQAFADVQAFLGHRPRWAGVRAAHRERRGIPTRFFDLWDRWTSGSSSS